MIRRARCVARQTDPKVFQIFSYQDGVSEWLLDASGIWIWSLLTDGMALDDLVVQITQQFPELSAEDAKVEVDKLIESGLLIQTSAVTPSDQKKDDINNRVSNLNVFITKPVEIALNQYEGQSYLLYLLWHCSDTVTIVESADLADIVFCSGAKERDAIRHEADDSDRLYVLVSGSPKAEQPDTFDYIISSQEAWSPYHLKWLRIPAETFDPQYRLPPRMRALDSISGYNVIRLANRFLRFLVGSPEVVSEKSSSEKPFLTIGMATYDDYDGVYFSIVSLRLHHAEVFEKSEIIILDNNPDGVAGPDLQRLADNIPNVRYVPYTDYNSTAVRDILFRIARGKWVVCMDCHVMLPPNSLSRLVDYMKDHPDSKDLLQGPLLDDAGKPLGSHFEPKWSSGMFGSWGWDKRADNVDNAPFEIPMQGLGLFACRKSVWPGFNPLFSGFGGEEGYIHQKFRNQGGRCLCLPFFTWAHRFARPHGAKYPLNWIDRIKNYLIGFDEAGLDTEQIETHFSEHLNPAIVQQAKDDVKILMHSPFHQFEYAACINLDSESSKWRAMQTRIEKLGIADRVKRFSAIATPEFHHIGCALSHREIIAHAKKFGYKNVLVFEDDALMLSGCEVYLAQAMKELAGKAWKILYLGGAQHGLDYDFDEGCQHLIKVPKQELTCTHALVYHESVYDEILQELPSTEDEMADWLLEQPGLDQYLCKFDARYLVYPKPFTQPVMQNLEDEPYQYFYS